WDREVLVLFTGTGTGWLQEWSLSAIEFLTAGNCATASLQYSVYTSALSFLADRRSPEQAGHLLFDAVRRRLDRMPPARRPRLFVAGESLGSFGGHAAFRDVPDMLARVDGAVWTGTPSVTPMCRELVSAAVPAPPRSPRSSTTAGTSAWSRVLVTCTRTTGEGSTRGGSTRAWSMPSTPPTRWPGGNL